MDSFLHDGDALAYEVHGGPGPTVLCLPGMGDLRSQYRHLVPLLVARGCRVVTMDLRGHGDSGTAFTRFDPQAVGEDAVALLDHLGVAQAVIVGNSAGAASAVWAATVAPDRVCGVGLLGPVVRDLPGSWWMRWLVAVLLLPAWGAWAWAAFYRTLLADHPPADAEAHVAAVRAAMADGRRRRAAWRNGTDAKAPIEARLGQIACPSVVVMGSADPDFADPAAEAQAIATRTGGTAVVLQGVGHYPHQELPDATVAALAPLLEGVACRASA